MSSAPNRRLVLVVEDSLAALTRISEALEARGAPALFMAQVDSITPDRIEGRHWLGGREEPQAAPWRSVAVLLCDYQILGASTGADVVRAADSASVPTIIGMSSEAGFNRRLIEAGAGLAHPKPELLRRLESGELDRLFQGLD